MKDLVVLAPDKNVSLGIKGLLSRHESLNIKEISYDIFVHPQRDPGIYRDAANFLRRLSGQYFYALVFLDHEGSGKESMTPHEMAAKIKGEIQRNGWPDRAEVIVFDPEFEIWVWIDSPHIASALGWSGDFSNLKDWLTRKGLWEQNNVKPKRPKEAVEASLRNKGIPRSSSIYYEIGHKVSFKKCQDQSFKRLLTILQKWFSKEG